MNSSQTTAPIPIPLNPFPHSNIDILNPSFPLITTTEVNRIILYLKHKAPGHSGLTVYEVKHLSANMISHLALIFNSCLSVGYFPKPLKHALMICIPKSLTIPKPCRKLHTHYIFPSRNPWQNSRLNSQHPLQPPPYTTRPLQRQPTCIQEILRDAHCPCHISGVPYKIYVNNKNAF